MIQVCNHTQLTQFKR